MGDDGEEGRGMEFGRVLIGMIWKEERLEDEI